jgi:hypothetical protein
VCRRVQGVDQPRSAGDKADPLCESGRPATLVRARFSHFPGLQALLDQINPWPLKDQAGDQETETTRRLLVVVLS